MWTLVREHLVVKIALVLLVTLSLGFAIPAAINAHLQLEEMRRSGHAAAQSVAQGLAAGVRTAMLSGNGITARSMIRDARGRLSTAEVHIYAPTGEEVFGEIPPPPPTSELPSHVQEALGGQVPTPPDAATTVLPIPNEPRCQRCHPEGTMRGVLTLGTGGATVSLDGEDEALDVLGTVTTSAFVQIMTAEHEDDLDAYFTELAEQVEGIRGVSVLGPDGELAFGAESPVAATELQRLIEGGRNTTLTSGGRTVRVRPLANDPQCHACHEAKDRWRGALLTITDPLPRPRSTLVGTTDVSLRHVMLAGLGRLIARFLDEVAATGAVTSLSLYDGEGRLYRDAFAHPTPSAAVAAALDPSGTGDAHGDLQADDARFVFVTALANDAECQQCHGNDYPVRGAIEVVIDTSDAASSRRRLVVTGIGFAVLTIGLTIVLLYLGLRTLVVRPVATMGDVADRVGQGQLDMRVPVRSQDEIGRLAHRLNLMIEEIRKKLELSKFVSKATMGTVDAAKSGIQRQGERTKLTVLFSDVRGFTAFSETVEPEEVVQMLNRYLEAQAEVVEEHGGDIDKFVGDELMATFRGPDMEARALACAVRMVEVVERINDALPEGVPRLQIGVGINMGEMVLGAMGARNRMDFTVIGDAVNLGARLCSAAEPGQVLMTTAVRVAAGNPEGVRFEPLPPLRAKGKREPIEVFGVRPGVDATRSGHSGGAAHS
ncbi:adenylate/guanylate cyclase domain-containing protein [Paraliomyxa miuraensis]|uniref:adenylate/guanylate cyclase domain-containing protein n=1 Tax=Paraliomyxa miuraensis TaxID=376150 RepID=UPI002250166B|nr:adenylate/guanylate cyclase domain-containing protein [Paraliomyxa miuraensis]MCX4243872.1 HAMP domain-containing protein [Paraliomyxa miuraensis]